MCMLCIFFWVFPRRQIKKIHKIQNTAKLWNQECNVYDFSLIILSVFLVFFCSSWSFCPNFCTWIIKIWTDMKQCYQHILKVRTAERALHPYTVRSESRCALRIRHVDFVVSIRSKLNEWKTAINAYIRNISQAGLQKVIAIKLNGFGPIWTLVNITSNDYYKCTATLRTKICRKWLRIKLNRFGPIWTIVNITSNTFYKCTATLPTKICRKWLRIKLNVFRPEETLVEITVCK
jgi:hypothetical protein